MLATIFCDGVLAEQLLVFGLKDVNLEQRRGRYEVHRRARAWHKIPNHMASN